MDTGLIELIINALLGVSAFTAGYLWRGPQIYSTESVRVQYVDKPTVVEKIIEKVRIEYVDRPVVVEKPTIQIREVPVHTETIREVAAPSVLERARALVAPPVTPGSGTARLLLMDRDERHVQHTEIINAQSRRPTLVRDGRKFSCARQAANGDWIYRHLPRERS